MPVYCSTEQLLASVFRGTTRNWCSLNAALKRSHAIPDGLKLFRARKSDWMWSHMMLSYAACVVVSYPAWPGIYIIMHQIHLPFSFRSFWNCIVERKNGCFIAQRCLNRYKIDKFCTIERKMEDIFVQRNNLLSFSKRSTCRIQTL